MSPQVMKGKNMGKNKRSVEMTYWVHEKQIKQQAKVLRGPQLEGNRKCRVILFVVKPQV